MKLPPNDLRRQFEACAPDARDLTEGVSAGQLQWSPAGKWSIPECLDHLNKAENLLSRFDRKFDDAQARGWTGQGPFRAGLLAGLFIKLMEPPVRRIRFKSSKALRPRPAAELEGAVPRFLRPQDGLLQRLGAGEGPDLSRVRISSPDVRRFKMSAIEWCAFLAAHQRRHLWQARNVRNHPEFPGNRDVAE